MAQKKTVYAICHMNVKPYKALIIREHCHQVESFPTQLNELLASIVHASHSFLHTEYDF